MFSGQLTTPDRFSYHTGRQPRFVLIKRAEKNNRLSLREKCGLITEKSIITAFSRPICKAVQAIRHCHKNYSLSLVGAVIILFVSMYKTHLLSLHCNYNKTHP